MASRNHIRSSSSWRSLLIFFFLSVVVLACGLSFAEAWGSVAQQQQQQQQQRRYTSCRTRPTTLSSSRILENSCISRGGAINQRQQQQHISYSTTVTQKSVVSAAATSLLAGSVAGAVGVGVAFPFDTLKTKAQVMETETRMSTAQVIKNVYKQEGIQGFFGGVRGMMLGQAVIKSIAFSVNAVTLAVLNQQFPQLVPVVGLLSASCFAGFVTSFVVTPVERVKVMMQATNGVYANEWDCLQSILKKEGWSGLLSRGLGPTLAREVPSYGIYFFIYGVLMQTEAASWLGSAAPLLFGALSGMSCWLPVYPVDVVKTVVQNTEGEDICAWEVMGDLYQTGGVGAFFDGLTPKMIRAAINHAVTFYIYDLVLSFLSK